MWKYVWCILCSRELSFHYSDVIMIAIAFQISSVSIVCSIVSSCADQRSHESSASLAFVMGIHRWPVDSTHKRPVTWKMFLFDNVIMCIYSGWYWSRSITVVVPEIGLLSKEVNRKYYNHIHFQTNRLTLTWPDYLHYHNVDVNIGGWMVILGKWYSLCNE